ncbi:hypothetical protein, partial [Salegentibacter agarivorans]|uniref:hypothetical protein n=1 Tax=Salegentibacter agarivorans TaxID=345907 RepID=UPI001C433244
MIDLIKGKSPGKLISGAFCLPCMQTIPGLERKSAHLIGGKSNAKSSASLATVGCEGRPSKLVEHREIEPILAYIGGKVAKSA